MFATAQAVSCPVLSDTQADGVLLHRRVGWLIAGMCGWSQGRLPHGRGFSNSLLFLCGTIVVAFLCMSASGLHVRGLFGSLCEMFERGVVLKSFKEGDTSPGKHEP